MIFSQGKASSGDLHMYMELRREANLAWMALWRLNYIPFINGNGRTARAASYFVLCCKAGGWLPGNPILPELLRQNRPAYVAALQKADASFWPLVSSTCLIFTHLSRTCWANSWHRSRQRSNHSSPRLSRKLTFSPNLAAVLKRSERSANGSSIDRQAHE
jgi:hypothetical protein